MYLAKFLWILLGLLSLGLGYLGVFVPGLPTTVFVLIALYAFTRSSRRLHTWLRSLPVFSQAVEQADKYLATGTISKRVKIIAQGCAWTSFLFVLFTTGLGWPLLLVGLAALACSLFMWRTRTSLDEE